MAVQTYRELIVWQKAMDLTVQVYAFLKLLPREELYALSSQMKRAAVSIPSNISEGFRRAHVAEQRQFFNIAYGTGAELETQIEICKRIGYCNDKQVQFIVAILDEVMRMLNVLRRSGSLRATN